MNRDTRLIWELYQKEEGGTADLAVKVLVGAGIAFGVATALSPDFRNWLADQLVKGVFSADEALTRAHDRIQQQKTEAETLTPEPPPTKNQPPLDVPPLPQ